MTYDEILGTIPGNENDKDLKYFHDKSKCFAGYLTIGLFLQSFWPLLINFKALCMAIGSINSNKYL